MQNKPTIPESGSNGHNVSAPALAATDGVLAREFHNVLTDAEDLIQATRTLTGEALAQARAKFGERIQAARKSAEQMGGAIADRSRAAATSTNAYVHEQPWQAIGAAAVVGALLGFLLARRS
jgi:ElaB/YqjD/DUF883 family membrane-anchored ribosome-binding protein